MTLNRSIVLMFAAAFLVCSSGAVNAQAPAETVPNQQTDVRTDRDDRDFDWGLLGLLGLVGLGGLVGRRDEITTTTRRAP
jgi:MYXO-CTERM domain-containing protein